MERSAPLPPSARVRPIDADAPGVMVVMYHYVRDRESPPTGEAPRSSTGDTGDSGSASPQTECRPGFSRRVAGLSETQFAAQLDRLCGQMEPIDWPRLYAGLAGRASLPRQAFILTFDDGLLDHARIVTPALEARGLRGVFFVPGAVLASHRMLPAHAIHLLLATLGDEKLAETLLACLARLDPRIDWRSRFAHPEADKVRSAAGFYGYESPPRARLKYFLTMELPVDLRTAAVEALFEEHIGSTAEWSRRWYLGWEDLVRMHAAGHTIGGHGYAHEPYGRLDPGEICRDIARASLILRRGLGADIRPFSYPYGSMSGPAFEACRESGFVHAFTTRRQWLTRQSHPLQLPRFDTVHVAAALDRPVAGAAR